MNEFKDIIKETFDIFDYILYVNTYVLKSYKLQTHVSYVLYIGKLKDYLKDKNISNFDELISEVNKWANQENSASIIGAVAKKFMTYALIVGKFKGVAIRENFIN